MDFTVLITCILIILARIGDVSLGTLRTVAVIYGRRYSAWFLGFFEVLIWIFVVSRVITAAKDEPLYAVCYALGFATGNFIGITIEQHIAYGHQVVRVFTKMGHQMADALRDEGYRVTQFDGRGRSGPVALLYINTPRKRTPELARRAREIDASCYYTVDDIRSASAATTLSMNPQGGWRSLLKRK
jgi:uncharacterized protein YebE (UPF0316 family)